MEQVILGFTGHRPKDLDITQSQFHKLLDDTLNDPDGVPDVDYTFITGGALGIDTWAAQYAMDNDIPLWLILPFDVPVMAKMWSNVDTAKLLETRHYADRVETITTGDYHPMFYQRRNERMVDLSNVMWTYWTGKRFGGTWNCLVYAIKQGKPAWNLRTKEWVR